MTLCTLVQNREPTNSQFQWHWAHNNLNTVFNIIITTIQLAITQKKTWISQGNLTCACLDHHRRMNFKINFYNFRWTRPDPATRRNLQKSWPDPTRPKPRVDLTRGYLWILFPQRIYSIWEYLAQTPIDSNLEFVNKYSDLKSLPPTDIFSLFCLSLSGSRELTVS